MNKVLIIIGSLRMGGAEKIMVDLAEYIDKSDFDIYFLVYGEKEEIYEEKVKNYGGHIIHIKRPRPLYLSYYRELKYINRQCGGFDILHTCTLLNNGLNILFFKILGCKKRISHSHSTNSGRENTFLTKIYERLMRKVIRCCATDYVACGEAAGEYLYGKEFFREKGAIIPNGIDFRQFMFQPEIRTSLRKKWKLEHKFVIGNVARLDKLKNQVMLVDILFEIRKIYADTVLILIGEGAEREAICMRAEELDIRDHLLMLGAREDVNCLINMLDVFVMPSEYEGMPLSLIEAQVNGLPVVASDRISSEIRMSEAFQFIELYGKLSQWVEAILQYRIYQRDKSSAYEILKKFDIQLCSRQLEQIYRAEPRRR